MTPDRLLDHHDRARLWSDEDRRALPADLGPAYALALAVRALRCARGERPAGFKIGFTNRTIWARYGVHAPIWGTVWDGTAKHAERGPAEVGVAHACQPRLEPEVVFGIAATPPPAATLEQLYRCVDWLAPGFEVVQSHCPGWRFNAAETVADSGLHAALRVGPRLPVRTLAAGGAALDERLAGIAVRLSCDGTTVAEGHGRDVLGGPLHALLHFVHELQRCPDAPALVAGDVVTTGTWADAWPVAPGQRWQAAFDAPIGTFAVDIT